MRRGGKANGVLVHFRAAVGLAVVTHAGGRPDTSLAVRVTLAATPGGVGKRNWHDVGLRNLSRPVVEAWTGEHVRSCRGGFFVLFSFREVPLVACRPRLKGRVGSWCDIPWQAGISGDQGHLSCRRHGGSMAVLSARCTQPMRPNGHVESTPSAPAKPAFSISGTRETPRRFCGPDDRSRPCRALVAAS